MVVTSRTADAGAGLGLVVVEDGQDAEDDGHAEVEADAHQAMRHGVGDVLEVHGLALDQHADGDDRVEGLLRGGRGGRGRRRQVRRATPQQIGRRGRARRRLLDLRGRVESVNFKQMPPGR